MHFQGSRVFHVCILAILTLLPIDAAGGRGPGDAEPDVQATARPRAGRWAATSGTAHLRLDVATLEGLGVSLSAAAAREGEWALPLVPDASSLTVAAAGAAPRITIGHIQTRGIDMMTLTAGDAVQTFLVGDLAIGLSPDAALLIDGRDTMRDVFEVAPGGLRVTWSEREDALVLTGDLTLSRSLAIGLLGLPATPQVRIGTLTVTACLASDTRPLMQPPQEPWLPASTGANLIVADLTGPANWGSVSAVAAYSIGRTYCNVGSAVVDWFEPLASRYPLFGQQVYRLTTAPGTNYLRFEQIGMSWLRHEFCALQQNLCSNCVPPGACCCSQLGVGCSEPTTAARAGSFSILGPRQEVTPSTGEFPLPHGLSTGPTTLRGRININVSDITNQPPGTQYVGELMSWARDDAGSLNDGNNASYRRVTFSSTPPSYNMSFIGATVREQPALFYWQTVDPQVAFTSIDVPNDGVFSAVPNVPLYPPKSGRFILGYRVTQNADGSWHYEYALLNLNCHRAARSLAVPLGAACVASNVGFHDVDYHSGELQVGTDWAVSQQAATLTWATAAYSPANALTANALRFGTLYNFRFDADQPPIAGQITIGLFRPPNLPGDPTAVTAGALVPSGTAPAPADIDGDGLITSTDLDLFVAVLLGLQTDPCYVARCDFTGDGPAGDDIPAFLAAYYP